MPYSDVGAAIKVMSKPSNEETEKVQILRSWKIVGNLD